MAPASSKEFLDIKANYRVWIHSETRTWHDNNIQSPIKESDFKESVCFLWTREIAMFLTGFWHITFYRHDLNDLSLAALVAAETSINFKGLRVFGIRHFISNDNLDK